MIGSFIYFSHWAVQALEFSFKPVQPLEIFLRVTAGRPWSVAALRSRAVSHNSRYITGIFANSQNWRGRIGVGAKDRVI